MAAPALSPHNLLRYPAWQGECRAALLELDQQTLPARVAAAETAIVVRLPAIAQSPEGRGERQRIDVTFSTSLTSSLSYRSRCWRP
jgi:hypothetical protein